MKKLIITALSLCVVIFGATFAGAVGDGTIDIGLSGTKEIAPNAFQMSFTVETVNKDSQIAIKENKENSENLYNALKSAIKTDRGDYIKTSDYSVRPNYEYGSKGKKTLKGYTVTNSVIVFVLFFVCKHGVPWRKYDWLAFKKFKNLCRNIFLLYDQSEHIFVEPFIGHY